MLTVTPELKVSFLPTHRGDCRQKFRTVVGLLASRQGEESIPVVTNAEETLPSTQQRCRHPEFHIQISCLQAHSRAWYCNRSTLVVHSLQRLPRPPPRSPRGKFHIARCAAAVPSDLACLVLFFTTKSTSPKHQVLLHKRGTSVSVLCGSQTLFSVSRRNRREAKVVFSAPVTSWCCSMTDGGSSCQCLVWVLCHVCFLPCSMLQGRMPCLISCSHQLSGPSGKPMEGPLARRKRARRPPMPAHPTKNAVSHSH